MSKSGLIGLVLVLPIAIASTVQAKDTLPSGNSPSNGSSSDSSSGSDSSSSKKPPTNCRAPDAPYREYKCLESHLGTGFLERLINYYRLEWNHEKAPQDPDAPESRRKYWPDAPTTTPPYP